jgi:hypothetical protein
VSKEKGTKEIFLYIIIFATRVTLINYAITPREKFRDFSLVTS